MEKYKSALDIIIDSLTDSDWAQLELRMDKKKELQNAGIENAKKLGANKFADWLLSQKNINITIDDNGNRCWGLKHEPIYITTLKPGETTFTSDELHNIFLSGIFDIKLDNYQPNYNITVDNRIDEIRN
jgi:hypothetical protein